MTGSGVPSDYEVLIDLDGDDEPPYPVGTLSTFGLAKASDPNSSHGGAGISEVYDITDAAERLEKRQKIEAEMAVEVLERLKKLGRVE